MASTEWLQGQIAGFATTFVFAVVLIPITNAYCEVHECHYDFRVYSSLFLVFAGGHAIPIKVSNKTETAAWMRAVSRMCLGVFSWWFHVTAGSDVFDLLDVAYVLLVVLLEVISNSPELREAWVYFLSHIVAVLMTCAYIFNAHLIPWLHFQIFIAVCVAFAVRMWVHMAWALLTMDGVLTENGAKVLFVSTAKAIIVVSGIILLWAFAYENPKVWHSLIAHILSSCALELSDLIECEIQYHDSNAAPVLDGGEATQYV